MSELPSDGRKLGDGQGQLFILLVQQQWGSPVTSQRRCMTLLWSKCPCYTSLGAFSVFNSCWEATVRRFYSFSRLFTNRHGNTGQLQACDAGQESDEEEREIEKEKEKGDGTRRRSAQPPITRCQRAAGCH
ncbi:hypothetical protein ALC56_11620 [Trachymyrmex septentrionalis]|uniref:Uncharacterized protein n=1 Tax=Trachymyrmex septentrionalis TaxID=34720 RepID=A0A195F0L1_9HYME|nr:hypothetical protein ALC56_11620 [Trachymyrmex septentrionalis]